ncbi:hypothetical protein [Delftia tsuruhatensis]|uniref:hypothetical protein n=1 Tax=Delftia tsuruhatensis TaxID=180282 RepID=UPI002449D7D7|nr:hypothetical protein [Delftia tsuruhatensis]MDH0423523.1 hypothetical protein [Delftia tsuruhatensis]
MSKYYADDDIQLLANGAVNHLLRNAYMSITLRNGQQPKGFPLPNKRVHGEGHLTQEYRPLAILEWIQDVVSGEVARRAAAKKAKTEEQTTP